MRDDLLPEHVVATGYVWKSARRERAVVVEVLEERVAGTCFTSQSIVSYASDAMVGGPVCCAPSGAALIAAAANQRRAAGMTSDHEERSARRASKSP
jgi:hypothetical protein